MYRIRYKGCWLEYVKFQDDLIEYIASAFKNTI